MSKQSKSLTSAFECVWTNQYLYSITQCSRPLKISVTSATPHAYCGYGVGRPLRHAGTGGVRVVVGRHVRRIFARDAASRSRLNVFLGEKRRQRRRRSRSHSEQHLHM